MNALWVGREAIPQKNRLSHALKQNRYTWKLGL